MLQLCNNIAGATIKLKMYKHIINITPKKTVKERLVQSNREKRGKSW